MTTHRSRRQRDRVVPTLEALEDRSLLSCTVFQNAGILTIAGDNLTNAVKVSDNGTYGFGAIKVQCDGMTKISTMPIHEIRVMTLGGTDRVSYTLTGPLIALGQRMVRVNLGAGNDSFQASFANPLTGAGSDLLAGSTFQLNVAGGLGNDNLAVDATHDVDVQAGAKFGVQLYGNDGISLFPDLGADSLSIAHHGEVDGWIGFGANGEAGNDPLVSIVAMVDPGSTGHLDLRVNGGVGADPNLRLFVFNRPPACTLNALLDGGLDAQPDVAFVGGDPAIQVVHIP
jgi:hypothetical protein